MPRTKESELKKLEKKIRTLAWYKHIELKAGADNPNQLASPDEPGYRKWNYYATGQQTPTQTTLKRAEKKYPGSIYVFNHGPEHSGLFDAMFNNLYENMMSRKQDDHSNYRYHWPIGGLSTYPTFREISRFLFTMNEMVKSSDGLVDTNYELILKILSYLSNLYRHTIEMSQFIYNAKVSTKCYQIISDSLKLIKIIQALQKYNIYSEYKIWFDYQQQNRISHELVQAQGRIKHPRK